MRGLKPELMCNSSAVPPVAPYVGAWIETWFSEPQHNPYQVAPYVGAWIETPKWMGADYLTQVAPYVGAWIETMHYDSEAKRMASRTLRGCVD